MNKNSKFEYNLVPFAQFDLSKPVVLLLETADDHQMVLSGVVLDKLWDNYNQNEHSDIQCHTSRTSGGY